MPWSINELMHLTRDELCGLSGNIEHALPGLEAGTVGRLNALQASTIFAASWSCAACTIERDGKRRKPLPAFPAGATWSRIFSAG